MRAVLALSVALSAVMLSTAVGNAADPGPGASAATAQNINIGKRLLQQEARLGVRASGPLAEQRLATLEERAFQELRSGDFERRLAAVESAPIPPDAPGKKRCVAEPTAVSSGMSGKCTAPSTGTSLPSTRSSGGPGGPWSVGGVAHGASNFQTGHGGSVASSAPGITADDFPDQDKTNIVGSRYSSNYSVRPVTASIQQFKSAAVVQFLKAGEPVSVNKDRSIITFDCENSSALVAANMCEITLRGSYKDLQIKGNKNVVRVAKLTDIKIRGDGNNVAYSSLIPPKVVVEGSKNTVSKRTPAGRSR